MWRFAGINGIGTIIVAANAQIYYSGTAIGIRRGIGDGSGDDILRFKVNDVKKQGNIGLHKDRPFRKDSLLTILPNKNRDVNLRYEERENIV